MKKYIIPIILFCLVFCKRKKITSIEWDNNEEDFTFLKEDEVITNETLVEQVKPSPKPIMKTKAKKESSLTKEKHERVFDKVKPITKKPIFTFPKLDVQKPMKTNDLRKQYTDNSLLSRGLDNSKTFLKKSRFNKKSFKF